MPVEVGSVEVLKALGQTAGAVGVGAAQGGVTQATPGSPLTLTITTKVIDLVGKHLDRILDRFNPPQETEKKVTGKQMLEKAQDAKAKAGGGKPRPEEKKSAFKGIEAVEAFEVFVGLQDPNITLGQFSVWIEKNKEKMAKAIDVVLKKI